MYKRQGDGRAPGPGEKDRRGQITGGLHIIHTGHDAEKKKDRIIAAKQKISYYEYTTAPVMGQEKGESKGMELIKKLNLEILANTKTNVY